MSRPCTRRAEPRQDLGPTNAAGSRWTLSLSGYRLRRVSGSARSAALTPKCPCGYVSRETGLNTSVIAIHSPPYRINATKDQARRRGEPHARHRWIPGMD